MQSCDWLNVGLAAATLSMALAACGGIEAAAVGPSGNGGTAPATRTSTTTSTAGGATSTATTFTTTGGTVVATGGTAPFTTAAGEAGNVTACPGIPAAASDVATVATACNGASLEVEPLPVDMIILMDRSIANSYAIGSDTATPAGVGQLRRWDVLTSAMEALAASPQAAWIGASITFFSMTGSNSDIDNCSAPDYAQPIVPLGLLSTTGPPIVAAMRALTPAGLSPTVPALLGAFEYATAEQQKDTLREKAVVLISDVFPTQCSLRSPADMYNVIATAAAAPVPIRTFLIGFGSTPRLTTTMFSPESFARAGNTDKPYWLDETAGAAAVTTQLTNALLAIAHSPLACEYEISPPSPDWLIDPNQVLLFYQPTVGDLQEIPKVSNLGTCAKSLNGGWYFDNPAAPGKISACPCSCANFGAGQVRVVYGCRPPIYIDD